MSQASTIEDRLALVEKDVTELKSEFSRLGSKRDRVEPRMAARSDAPAFKETTPLTDLGALIAQTPGICGGRPRLAGTGVSIRRIVGWYKLGWTPEEIADRIGHI